VVTRLASASVSEDAAGQAAKGQGEKPGGSLLDSGLSGHSHLVISISVDIWPPIFSLMLI
jgi:hypothetical protein